MKQVVIVGGGISGLATAHALLSSGVSAPSVTLLEASPRLGGNIVTETREGFVIDGGPDAWVASKPQAGELARELGLGDEIVPTIEANRRVYIAYGDELHALPEGLVLGVPTRIRPILASRLFSVAGKARMGLEPFIPQKDWSGDADESIGGFITRRLGAEVNDRLAAPLLGGIFAGDASELSLRATFPQLIAAERDHGSLVLSMRAARAKASPGKGAPSMFFSLRSGLGTLVDKLVERLGPVTIRRNEAATRVERAPEGVGYVVTTQAGRYPADEVVLATPSHISEKLVGGFSLELGESLRVLSYVSTATCFLAFKRDQVDHPLDATGFLIPRTLKRPILAATWVSSKWPDRAPDGHVLMRVFFGGAWGEEVLAKDDAELSDIAYRELSRFMSLRGDPLFSRVFRFHKTNPQPKVGHLTKMAAQRTLLRDLGGLHVVGSGFDGVGISDCIRQGREAAERIVQPQT